MFNASKVENKTKFTYTKSDIMKAIREQLEKGGYRIEAMVWNETNSKLEVEAVKVK